MILEGIFEVPEADVYQFQLQGNSVAALTVNDQPVFEHRRGNRARRSPGRRSRCTWPRACIGSQIEGIVARSPIAQSGFGFGGPGCTSLDGKRFRHIEK